VWCCWLYKVTQSDIILKIVKDYKLVALTYSCKQILFGSERVNEEAVGVHSDSGGEEKETEEEPLEEWEHVAKGSMIMWNLFGKHGIQVHDKLIF
jgi:hypothetical protein